MGIWPPTRPVLPACGTTGMPCSWASARICDTSSVEPGPQHDGGAALVHVAPLAQVGQLLVGIGERVLRADDGAQAIDQLGRKPLGVGAVVHGALAARRSRSLMASPSPCSRDRHDGNGRGARGVERAQGGEQVGGGLRRGRPTG